ncbi:DUF6642 family protein [Blastococcus sp. SYSU D00669]
MGGNGIFCLEGDWGSSLTDRTSVRLGLDMLMTVRRGRLIHRNAATKQEFAHYMDRWCLQQYRNFPVAYFSYHGDRSVLSLGKDDVTLTEVSDMVTRPLSDRILYFASCGTMSAPADELMEFVGVTGAKAVVGYTKNVGWAESAAFDFTLLPALLDRVDMRRLFTHLRERHPYFVEGLGLRIATSRWALPA